MIVRSFFYNSSAPVFVHAGECFGAIGECMKSVREIRNQQNLICNKKK